MSKAKKLWVIFSNMLFISAFTFGGGFVITSFMKKRFVDKLNMLEENEMLDFVAISQSCPGAIAVNCAILTGWRLAGLPGMIAATLGTVIPPFAILCIISLIYKSFASNTYVAMFLKGMQAGVSAVIFDVVYTLAKNVFKTKSFPCIAVMFLAFAAVVFFNVDVIVIIAASFCIGVAAVIYQKVKGRDKL